MLKTLNIEAERAIRFLAQYMPPSDENSRKPIIFHDVRVGIYLYEHGYNQDMVVAGILHDTIEWSSVDIDLIKKEFGENVAKLVLASTKDDSILDKKEKAHELIQRCIQTGQEALIIKTADILDSFKWYSSQNNEDELKNHCVKNAQAILKFKPAEFNDKIFDELKAWQDKYSS